MRWEVIIEGLELIVVYEAIVIFHFFSGLSCIGYLTLHVFRVWKFILKGDAITKHFQ